MFIASQDDLLARFSATYEENKRLKSEVERLTQLQTETLNERNKAEAEVARLNERLDKVAPLIASGGYSTVEQVIAVDEARSNMWNNSTTLIKPE